MLAAQSFLTINYKGDEFPFCRLYGKAWAHLPQGYGSPLGCSWICCTFFGCFLRMLRRVSLWKVKWTQSFNEVLIDRLGKSWAKLNRHSRETGTPWAMRSFSAFSGCIFCWFTGQVLWVGVLVLLATPYKRAEFFHGPAAEGFCLHALPVNCILKCILSFELMWMTFSEIAKCW